MITDYERGYAAAMNEMLKLRNDLITAQQLRDNPELAQPANCDFESLTISERQDIYDLADLVKLRVKGHLWLEAFNTCSELSFLLLSKRLVGKGGEHGA